MDDIRVHISDIPKTYEYILYILFFPLLFGMFIGIDKRVGFRHAIDDEEYVFSYSELELKHRTS